ncbi:hypothetical protein BGZ60DRAFT_522880 [Tricladium varicosporioides]|nr:hypothetical protein BGZ60DRAFT_522880 [Hymenoscyphus varicosporioides]
MPLRSSSNCCISRGPPSPDVEPPRLAHNSPHSNPHLADAFTLSPGSSAAVAELRPIFEDDDITETEVVHAKHNSTYKLRSFLLGENEDKSDTEDECERIRVKKSSATLDAVRQKLRKHLSRESALSKRRSKSSVGTSEEEVERRAELRRIRHKRIQEELSNEAVYDDDAKTLSSLVDADSSMGMTSRSSWVPGELIASHPRLLTPSLPYPVILAPTMPPLKEANSTLGEVKIDTVERSVSQSLIQRNNLSSTEVYETLARSGTIVRRHSSPFLKQANVDRLGLQVYQPIRKRSFDIPMPLSSVPRPSRLSSRTELRKSSWRLSFASSKRGEVLRKLSQEHKTTMPPNPEQSSTSTPSLKRWLYAQGLRSPSKVIQGSEESMNLDVLASHEHTCTPSQDFGGVDGGAEQDSSSIHLHKMGISQRLASKALQASSSSPQLSSWSSHQRGASSISDISRVIRSERARYLRYTSDSVPLSERIPQSWGKILSDGTSSFYPSTMNSMQPSPESSRFNLVSLLTGSKAKVLSAEFGETEKTQVGPPLTTTTTASDSSPSRPIPLTRQPRRPAFDDSSILASETDSFREREAELSVIKTRFASSEAHRSPSTPVSSKFREEFDLENLPPDTPITRKPSAFARLARLAIRSYDGPAMEEILSVPMPDFSPDELRRNKLVEEDVLGGVWGKAVKKDDRKKSRKGSIEDELVTKSILGGFRRKKPKKVNINDHKSAAEEYQKRFDERVAVKELVMDSWEEEMAATAAKAKAKSRNIVKKNKPTGPDRRYPATWSQFPSHSRDDRSKSAGPPDQIEAIDFAMAKRENGKEIWYHSERKLHLYHYDNDGHPSHADDLRKRNLKEKLEKTIENKMYNYQNSLEAPIPEDTFGRRSSMNTELKMEFPELEILGMEIMATDDMEREVEEELAEEERKEHLANTDMGTVDGAADSKTDGDPVEAIEVSISDPKFYEDCVVNVTEVLLATDRKRKYRTWSGKDWDGDRFESIRRGRNGRSGSLVLRKSTDDCCTELKLMEVLEREKVLQAAEEAWGRKK